MNRHQVIDRAADILRPILVRVFEQDKDAVAVDAAEAILPVIAAAILAPVREEATDFRDRIDLSDGRGNYGDNDAYEICARDLTRLCDTIEAEMRGGIE